MKQLINGRRLVCLMATLLGVQPRTASGQAGDLLLTRDGAANATIVWWSAEDAPPAEFAAHELRDYLERISGARLPVVRGRPGPGVPLKPAASGVVLVTGASRPREGEETAVPAQWVEAGARRLGAARGDAYTLDTVGGDKLVLTGVNHRSTLYAAYDLLERLGVRFFAPRFEFYHGRAEQVPRRGTISVPGVAILETADMEYRKKYIEEGNTHTSANIRQMVDWMAKRRMNVLVAPVDYKAQGFARWSDWREEIIPELERRGMTLEVGGHGYESFLHEEEYPQFYTSGGNVFDVHDEAAVRTYIEKVIAYLHAHPEIDIFAAWPPDGARWPEATVKKFGTIPNAEAYLINRLHQAVQEKLPGVRLERIAYGRARELPDARYMYDPAILVDYAMGGIHSADPSAAKVAGRRSYAVALTDPSSDVNAYNLQDISRWLKAFPGDISIYEYHIKYRWHSLPVLLPHMFIRETQALVRMGADGLGTYGEPANWLTYELIHMLCADIPWNASVDADRYVTTYLYERYGPAAAAMRRYYDLVARAGQTSWGPEEPYPYGTLAEVTSTRADYLRAMEALREASGVAPQASTAEMLVRRLTDNLHYALADIDIHYYRMRGEAEKSREAQVRTRNLVDRHLMEGILFPRSSAIGAWGIKTDGDVHKGQLLDAFRGATWAARLTLGPNPPALAVGGQTSELTATLVNTSPDPLESVELSFRVADGWIGHDLAPVRLGWLAPGDSVRISRRVRAPREAKAGSDGPVAEASYTFLGERSSLSVSALPRGVRGAAAGLPVDE